MPKLLCPRAHESGTRVWISPFVQRRAMPVCLGARCIFLLNRGLHLSLSAMH